MRPRVSSGGVGVSPVAVRPMTQVERLIAYLRSHPGASSLEVVRDLAIVNTTGRVSDIRALPGFDVECRKRSDGRDGYWLVVIEARPEPITGVQTGMAL